MAPDLEFNPQKALLVDHPPTGDRWVHELKLDGFRMGLFIHAGHIRILSRRGTDYTKAYPEIVAAAQSLSTQSAVIDGEVVVLDEHGVSQFHLLQRLAEDRRGLAYYAFDLLALDGADLTQLPLVERKARLAALVQAQHGIIRYSDHVEADGAQVLARACALGAEGIVSKTRDAPYRIGGRSAEWQKTKCTKRQEFVVGGFTDPESSRAGVGSLLIGHYEGDALRFAGKVGTGRGWTATFGAELRRQLDAMELEDSPFDPTPPGWLGQNAHWVQPSLIAEVAFTEWTEGGHVRHPTLQGFRPDKRPREVVRERAVQTHASAPVATGRRKRGIDPVYPGIGVTRQDLVDLMMDIADWALPHVEGRPLTLVRLRAPVTRESLLGKHAVFVRHAEHDQEFVSSVVPRVRIPEQKKIGEYVYVDSAQALAALPDAGVGEWHAWNACVSDVEHPDRMVFDLDPGDGVEWHSVVAAARRLRSLLEASDLASWVKTTGGKGLHVVVPFRPEHDWNTVFELTRHIAGAMAREAPESYTIDFGVSQRVGKILIDYKRNYRTSIAVAAFSPRARRGGAMSVPIGWSELGRVGGSDRWTVQNVRERLARLKRDPWREYWKCHQRIRMGRLTAYG